MGPFVGRGCQLSARATRRPGVCARYRRPRRVVGVLGQRRQGDLHPGTQWQRVEDRLQLLVGGRPVEAEGAPAPVVGQRLPHAQDVSLGGELGDAGRLAREPLLDLGRPGVVGDCDDELDEVVHDEAPGIGRWRFVGRHRIVNEVQTRVGSSDASKIVRSGGATSESGSIAMTLSTSGSDSCSSRAAPSS